MQLHGQVASILKCKQFVCILIREDSSRNTVQFLNETDRNHECQLRKSLEKILLINIRLIINATEKNACNYTYAVYVLYIWSIVWKLLEFPAMDDDLS